MGTTNDTSRLDPKEALLTYFVADAASYLWVVRHDAAVLIRLTIGKRDLALDVALLVGVRSRADEPARPDDKVATVLERLKQASTLVERLSERVNERRAALQEAETDLESARKRAFDEWKAVIQQRYEEEKRREGSKRADPVDPPFIILPVSR